MAKPSEKSPLGAGSREAAGAGGAESGKRKRLTTHRFRWNVRLLLGIPVMIALALLLVMRSALVVRMVGSSIKDLTGCTLQTNGRGELSSVIELDGRLVLRNFQLRLPGVPGEAGVLMSAERAVIDLDWSGIFTGEVTPTAIRLHEPVFRLSQATNDNQLNLGGLSSGMSSGGGAASAPRIDVIDGTILLTEHDPSGKTQTLREMKVSGAFTPIDPTRPVYTVRFAETGVAREVALLVDGKVNIQTGAAQMKLYNLALNAWPPESVPAAFREQWRRMNVRGRISHATLNYEKADGAQVQIHLDKVSMNAPIPAEGVDGAPDTMKDMGLQEVSGVVGFSPAGLKAELSGKIEGQAGESFIRLTTVGMELNSAMRCEIEAKRLGLTKETMLLPYMPDRARQYFRLFSGPTGEVDARVVVSRGAPVNGEAAPIEVSGGTLTLRNGAAAFHRFPYPFEQMSGTFEFDDTQLKIVDLRGRGPTGATLAATGIISPLTDEAMVDVNVHAEKVPVDQHLLDAMPGDRRRVLENVFSQGEYLRLVADNLVRVPGAVEAGSAMPLPPEFGLAGLCTIDVNVHTPKGKDSPWFTTIDVGFAEAGMLVDPFPLPVRARNVKLHITDDDAKLVSGEFSPLSGGTMEMSAYVTFFNGEKRETRPDVRIKATDVPVDRLLLHALPRDDEKRGVDPASAAAKDLSLGELMRRLNASGTVSCQAHITADPPEPGREGDAPRIAYDVRVDLAKARAEPRLGAEEATFSVEDLRGTLHLTRSEARLPGLEARLFRIPSKDAAAPFVGPIQCANLSLELTKMLEGGAPSQRGRMDATISVTDANLAEPIERFVGVFSPETGRRLGALREQHQPLGRLHATVRMMRPPGENVATGIGVTLDNATNIEFAALGGRLGVEWPVGMLEIVVPADGPERLRFENLQARLTLDGAACGDVRVDGSVALDGATGGVAPPADLTAEFADWRFESPFIVPLLRRLTSESTAQTYRALRATGPFDASIRVEGVGEIGAPAPRVSVKAELSPRAMGFDWEGQRVDCREVSGKVTLRTLAGTGSHPVSGRFDQLSVKTPGWDATADGEWYAPAYAATPGADRPVQLALKFGVSGRTMDAALRALIPKTAVEAVDALGAQFNGPFALRDGVVKTTLGDAPARTTFTGELEFDDLALSVGVPIEHATGRMTMSVQTGISTAGAAADGAKDRADRDAPAEFEIKVEADSMRVVGVAVTSVETVVISGTSDREILIPEITAQCYGGRMSGQARVVLAEVGVGSPAQVAAQSSGEPVARPVARPVAGEGHARYEAELMLAGVRLAPVLADAAAAGATDPGPVGPPNPFTDPDPSRGEIDARMTLSGTAGDLASRRGGGAIRVANGDIIKLPMMLPLIQVSNLQIPSKDRLGYLQSDFTIQGPKVVFDHVSLLSNSVAIVGTGTLAWPDLTLDMKFNSRSLSRVPILSDVLEVLRNEIVSTTVTGRLSSPVVSERPFSGTRAMIDRLLNPSAYVDVPRGVGTGGAVRDADADRKRMEDARDTTAVPNP